MTHQSSNTALTKLITIDQDFKKEHAAQVVSEIKILWPDLRKTDFTSYEVFVLARVLRQGRVQVQYRLLRAFLVAWKVLDVNFPSLHATSQAELIRDMTLCQFGAAEHTEPVPSDEEAVSTPEGKFGSEGQRQTPCRSANKEFSPGPFQLLFKTQKKWARQRQLRVLLSQAKKPEMKKDEQKVEDGCGGRESSLTDAEKRAFARQKLERRRKLKALNLKPKKRNP